MELKDLVSISGKSGLYKIIKPARSSIIVESFDHQKKKLMVNASQRVSVLDEISVYTNNEAGSTPLASVFEAIYHEYGEDEMLDKDATNNECHAFFKTVLPDYDQDRVYPSDIKKIVRWYHLLLDQAPQLIKPVTEEEE
jgi:hypothetical protein